MVQGLSNTTNNSHTDDKIYTESNDNICIQEDNIDEIIDSKESIYDNEDEDSIFIDDPHYMNLINRVNTKVLYKDNDDEDVYNDTHSYIEQIDSSSDENSIEQYTDKKEKIKWLDVNRQYQRKVLRGLPTNKPCIGDNFQTQISEFQGIINDNRCILNDTKSNIVTDTRAKKRTYHEANTYTAATTTSPLDEEEIDK